MKSFLDPPVIGLSMVLYRILIFFYPASFRREYGPHMEQVFRDSYLNAFRQTGSYGVLSFWGYTIFDWFKSVIEEHLNRESQMTREKFIRLSGWGLIVGPIALFLGLGEPQQYRLLLYKIFGPPYNTNYKTYYLVSDNVPVLLILMGILLIVFGIWGVRTRFLQRFSVTARYSLSFSMLCACCIPVGVYFSRYADIAWGISMLGILGMFSFIGIFGLFTAKNKPFSKWNSLPLITGAAFPLILFIEGLFFPSNDPYSVLAAFIISLLGLMLLGYLVQTEAPEKAAQEL